MRTSIWYHTADQQPFETGYYLCFQGWGIGGKADGDSDIEYLYYHKKTNKWYSYEGQVNSMHPDTRIVYYWTDADPSGWVDSDPPISQRKKHREDNPALKIAWDRVQESIRQYEIVRSLIGSN